MKKLMLCIMSCLVLFNLTGCGVSSKYQVTKEHRTETKYKETKEITYEEYEQKISNNETFILLLWQTGCSHCETFEPKLNKIIKQYNLEIFSLNLHDLSDKEYSTIKNKTFVSGTPTTVFIQDGKYVSKVVGDKDEEDIISFLVESGYLEEK